jgi:hypothetical protein
VPRPCTSSLVTLLLVLPAFADTDGGLAALRARLGSSAPTGAGIQVVQVEAPESPDAYAPDTSDPEFAGKSITKVNAPALNSWHGTNVARWLYGGSSAMAWGISSAWAYNVNSWINTNLKVGGGTSAPTAQPGSSVRVMNHSWIGSFGAGSETFDREALRRLDFMMTRDGVLGVCGENNGAGSARQPMMGDTFNGLSVGRMDLQHSAGGTTATGDHPGRMKPDIIAPGQFTSFSTPVVGSAAVVLFETIGGSAYSSLTASQKVQVVKACLLGGAERDENWSNEAPQEGDNRGTTNRPIDPLRGSGLLNVDRSHRILTATRVNGVSGVATATPPTESFGWGTATITPSQKSYWRFRVNQPTSAFDFTINWSRGVASNFASYTYANLNLRLFKLVDGSTLQPLEGDAGLEFFAGGNVSSTSVVDNIETLHLVGLEPGDYVVEISRADTSTVAFTAYATWALDEAAFGAVDGDLDGSGTVDAGDIGTMLTLFGTANPRADLDHSGTVDSGDIGELLLLFG